MNMKINRYIPCLWALVALIGLLFSCTLREVETPDNPAVEAAPGESFAYIVVPEDGGEDVSGWEVVAPAAAPATRTDFDSYVGTFTWSEGDKIAIHMNNGTYYETPVTPATGAFTASSTASVRRDSYAVYPSSAIDADNYGDPTLNVVLPAEYDIHDNLSSDFSPVPMVAVNDDTESDLYFRHVGGLLRITCDRVPVGTQKIAVTLDRNIAGTFAVANPSSDNPTISTGGSTATVTFKVAADALTERTNGIILNLPVPTGHFSSLRVAAINASGAEINASTRDLNLNVARYHGRKFICNVIPAFTDSMQMVISTSDENGLAFRLPFCGSGSTTEEILAAPVTFPSDLVVEWGDGSSISFEEGGSYPASDLSHTYDAVGDYTITLTATASAVDGNYIPSFSFANVESLKCNLLKSMPTPILRNPGNGTNAFKGCSELVSVCSGLFSKNPQYTSFLSTFDSCSSLRQIPEGLFDNNPDAVYFIQTFRVCKGLTGPIPQDLFAKNRKVKSFSCVFQACTGLTGSIPENLFKNNNVVEDFGFAFWGCSGLTGTIPVKLFSYSPDARVFQYVFCSCTGLTGSIPSGLFEKNTKATSFDDAFASCDGLTGSIPKELFAHNLKATSFGRVFYKCSGLSGMVPSGLFADHSEAVSFRDAFLGCSNLSVNGDLFTSSTVTPATRFASVTSSVNFSHCFFGLGSNLASAGTAPALWEFTFPADYPPVTENCFDSASFTNGDAIPDEWK